MAYKLRYKSSLATFSRNQELDTSSKAKIRTKSIIIRNQSYRNNLRAVRHERSNTHFQPETPDFFQILQEELEEAWKSKEIPEDICKIYRALEHILPKSKVAAIYSKELDDLSRNQAAVQKIIELINKREKVIERIIGMNEHLLQVPDWTRYVEVKEECVSLLKTLRMLTVVIIENIHKWKQSLLYSLKLHSSSSNLDVEFKWKGLSYMDKLKKDSDFLSSTELNKIFIISHLSDPFLLTPSRKYTSNSDEKSQVPVPITPALLKRIRMAEKILFGGYLKTHVNSSILEDLPSIFYKQTKLTEDVKFEIKISNNYINEVIDNECSSIALQVYVNTKLAKSMAFRTSEEFIARTCQEIAIETIENERLTKLLYKKLTEDMQSLLILESINIAISDDLYKEYVYEIASEIIEEIQEEDKIAQDLCNSLLAELSEEYSNKVSYKVYTEGKTEFEITIDFIASGLIDSEVHRECLYQALEVDLGKRILEDLLDSLFTTELLQKTQKSPITILLKEVKLIEILPPEGNIELLPEGEMSPNVYSINPSLTEEEVIDSISPLQMDTAYVYMNEQLAYLPLNVEEPLLMPTLQEYYSLIPEPFLTVSQPIDLLVKEAFAGVDPCWLWFSKDSKITGLLVFSYQHQSELGKFIKIHHLSCLNPFNFSKLLADTVSHLWDTSLSNYIRADLFNPNFEIPKEIKSIYERIGFTWKSVIVAYGYKATLVHLGIERERKLSVYEDKNVKIRTYNCLSFSSRQEADRSTNKAMIIAGNRINQLATIIGSFEEENKQLIKIPDDDVNRLQKDLRNLVEIVTSSEGFHFPFCNTLLSDDIQALNRFIKINWNKSIAIPEEKQAVSIMDINFNWMSCTNQESNNYKVLKFRSHSIVHKKNLESNIYLLTVDVPNLQVFFIQSKNLINELNFELKNLKTDLFYKIEDILKGAELSSKGIDELWVPAFRKNIEWEVPWIRGFPLEIEGQESLEHVGRLLEGVSINMDIPPLQEGLLLSENPKGKVIDTSFIFGVIESSVESLLEIPLFACLIEPTDWILK